jgi:uncharacterized protein YjiS (DUF1127 family)
LSCRGTLSPLGAAAKRLYAAYIAWRLEKTAIAALRSMSDSDLSDIGLTRGEIMSAVRGRAARLRQHVPEY